MGRYIKNRKGLNMYVKEHLFGDDEVFLLCHGFTGSIQSYVISETRAYLREREISSISIDFTNNINQAEGDFSQHTLTAEVEDLAVIYETVASRFKKVYLIGHSMGCTVALQFCLKQAVDGLLLIAPPYSMKDIIYIIADNNDGDAKAAIQKWERDGGYRFFKEKTQAYYTLSYDFYRDLDSQDPSRYRSIKVPTAIIYSLTDPLVPPVDSERLFSEISAERKMLRAIPDAPHSFNDPLSRQRMLQEVAQSLQFLRE
ncbi:hypothetical protein BEP19_16255 [Ammoniphilus oxalaticus]|uniref:AB hydrolase-1 domain-containing protein n=1 Tax=Ammoniphilus oxalaticus TaxID=66863 RepID=A0A419SQJ0_9BACL|nr:alpha/beta fold hydrolase [Ammoniphilus oxalaticus]RKD26752.1 hypothetical protein BEP19_16255 [Ammoniphilus oxalaticus]